MRKSAYVTVICLLAAAFVLLAGRPSSAKNIRLMNSDGSVTYCDGLDLRFRGGTLVHGDQTGCSSGDIYGVVGDFPGRGLCASITTSAYGDHYLVCLDGTWSVYWVPVDGTILEGNDGTWEVGTPPLSPAPSSVQ